MLLFFLMNCVQSLAIFCTTKDLYRKYSFFNYKIINKNKNFFLY